MLGRQDGWTPLHYAARTGRAEVVRALLQAKADTAARTKVRGRLPALCLQKPLSPCRPCPCSSRAARHLPWQEGMKRGPLHIL